METEGARDGDGERRGVSGVARGRLLNHLAFLLTKCDGTTPAHAHTHMPIQLWWASGSSAQEQKLCRLSCRY
jgi:hypothetical protein